MDKPRIFLGSSGKQAKLLQALTRGSEDIAHVEPWTTVFNPGTTTLGRLLELTREVDFAAFVFARDDWTSVGATASNTLESAQASPRDNVVFEAGLFGGVLGMRRTFILHANGAKLPSDLLGLTCVRYDASTTAADVKAINQKLRGAIESESALREWTACGGNTRSRNAPRASPLPSACCASRAIAEAGWCSPVVPGRRTAHCLRDTGAKPPGRATTGHPSSTTGRASGPWIPTRRNWKARARSNWNPPIAAAGYWITRASNEPTLNARTSGVYWRADSQDLAILDAHDQQQRAALIAERLQQWKSIAST